MKLFRPSRPATLKGLLFFALVANISWQPIANHFSQSDFASTTVPAPQSQGRLDCTGKDKQKCLDEAMTVQQRDTLAKKNAALKAQIDAEQKKKGKTTAAPNLSDKTEAQAGDVCVDCLQKEKTANEEKIKDLEKQIAEIKKKTQSTNVADNEDEDDDSSTASNDRPSVEDIRNCKVDSSGDDLSKIAEFECQTKRISSAKTSSEKREIARKIQDLYNSLRKDAKEDILAKDGDRRSDGEHTISSMITALNRVHFDRDSERTKMIDSLEGLRAGAEALEVALGLQDEVNSLQKDARDKRADLDKVYRDYQNSCRSRTGCNYELVEEFNEKKTELTDLKEEYNDLKQEITDAEDEVLDGEDGLNDYKSALSSAEVREFTAPFKKMKSQMNDLTDPRKVVDRDFQTVLGRDPISDGSGQSNLPQDFYQVRNGANNRSNGMYQFPAQQRPMGSGPMINQQMGQGSYTPQYMVPGMGMQNSMLPVPPGGMQNGMMMGPMGQPNVIPAGGGMRPPMYGGQQPTYGQQPYGNQPMGGNVIPYGRTY